MKSQLWYLNAAQARWEEKYGDEYTGPLEKYLDDADVDIR